MKLNINGARKEIFTAGCKGVIRDDKGAWIRGFEKSMGYCDAFMAELWGVVEGLNLTKLLGLRRVEINVDSMDIVHAIEKVNM